jgi:pimeloyl-ACP methyl ester carboxylesterase
VELVSLPDAGHVVPEEEPEVVARAIDDRLLTPMRRAAALP